MKTIIKQIDVAKSPLFKDTLDKSTLISECIMGEEFIVLKNKDNWSFGYLKKDKYKGWTPSKNLGGKLNNNYIVVTNSSIIFSKPDIKSKCLNLIPIGSQIQVIEKLENWHKISTSQKSMKSYGFCPNTHLIKKDDYLNWHKLKNVMNSMIGTPYLWGGRTNFGIDCSGLIQMLFYFAGIMIPRDTHQQISYFKRSTLFKNIEVQNDFIEYQNILSGDVIFWEGHVGIMYDSKNLLHANAFHMSVFVEPIKKTISRFRKQKIPLKKIYRYFK